jgi:hypothetical protein
MQAPLQPLELKVGDVLESPEGELFKVTVEGSVYNNERFTIKSLKDGIHYNMSAFGWVYLLKLELKPFKGAKLLWLNTR